MVFMMLSLGTCSLSAHMLSEAGSFTPGGTTTELGSGTQRYVLALPEEEVWRKHRVGLMQPAHSCSLLEPDNLISRTTSFDALYELRSQERESTLGLDSSSTFDLGQSQLIPVSPEVIKRRRGGLIEQRDIIKAHEAHKMQSTPQARRKEWDCPGMSYPHAMSTEVTEPNRCVEHGLLKIIQHDREHLHDSSPLNTSRLKLKE